jgi:hypothetical protein
MSSPQDKSAEREQRMAEELWLNYLNRYLVEAGVISQKEYTRMTELIATRKSKKSPSAEKNAIEVLQN